MKIYQVWGDINFEPSELLGTFGTEEDAKKCQEFYESNKRRKQWFNGISVSTEEALTFEEWIKQWITP